MDESPPKIRLLGAPTPTSARNWYAGCTELFSRMTEEAGLEVVVPHIVFVFGNS